MIKKIYNTNKNYHLNKLKNTHHLTYSENLINLIKNNELYYYYYYYYYY